MKRTVFTILFLFTASFLFAQQGFNYKALLSDNGNVMNQQNVEMQFSITDSSGTLLYQETQSLTTDVNGVVSCNIGEGTLVSGDFSAIDWSSGSLLLQVEIDTGNGFQNFGIETLRYVPYAKYAENAGNVFSGSYTDLTDTPDFTGWDTDASDDVQSLNDLSDVITHPNENSLYIGENAGTNETANMTNNTFVGYYSGSDLQTGSNNVGLGYNTMHQLETGNHNVAVGAWSLSSVTSGFSNTAIGVSSLESIQTGTGNTVLGWNAMRMGQTLQNNTALGEGAGYNNDGGGNIFIGYRAGYNETGNNKLYIENSDSATPLIGGDFNTDEVTVNGSLSIVDGTQGDGKIFISDANGKGSWQDMPAMAINDLTDALYVDHSLYLGPDAGMNDDGTDNRNTGVGYGALNQVVSGSSNVAMGYESLYHDQSGYDNVSIGDRALYDNTEGYGNTALGFNALYDNQSGDGNVALGRNAGKQTLGSGNVFLGYEAGYNEMGSNKLYIDNSSTGSPLIWGDFANDQVRINGEMEVTGNLNLPGKMTATDSGDADMKAYIYGAITVSGQTITGASSDGFSVSRTSAGKYTITFDNAPSSMNAYMVIATIANGFQGFITVVNSSDHFQIWIESKTGVSEDKPFNFVVYKK